MNIHTHTSNILILLFALLAFPYFTQAGGEGFACRYDIHGFDNATTFEVGDKLNVKLVSPCTGTLFTAVIFGDVYRNVPVKELKKKGHYEFKLRLRDPGRFRLVITMVVENAPEIIHLNSTSNFDRSGHRETHNGFTMYDREFSVKGEVDELIDGAPCAFHTGRWRRLEPLNNTRRLFSNLAYDPMEWVPYGDCKLETHEDLIKLVAEAKEKTWIHLYGDSIIRHIFLEYLCSTDHGVLGHSFKNVKIEKSNNLCYNKEQTILITYQAFFVKVEDGYTFESSKYGMNNWRPLDKETHLSQWYRANKLGFPELPTSAYVSFGTHANNLSPKDAYPFFKTVTSGFGGDFGKIKILLQTSVDSKSIEREYWPQQAIWNNYRIEARNRVAREVCFDVDVCKEAIDFFGPTLEGGFLIHTDAVHFRDMVQYTLGKMIIMDSFGIIP